MAVTKTMLSAARYFKNVKYSMLDMYLSSSPICLSKHRTIFTDFSFKQGQSINRPNMLNTCNFARQWKYFETLQHFLHISAVRNSNCNNMDDQETLSQVEHQLIGYMDGWEIEKAVDLLRNSVKIGILPKQYLILNLLQLLGNLGDFECLLSLREILMDNRLCSNDQFFGCLQEAYYNSGRLDEAVLLLKILYHDVRKFNEVDVFFTLIGVMILVHFPHRFDLMENFAKDCREKEPSDLLPTAGLWKCLMLTESFEEAQTLVTKHEEIKKYLPLMLNDILQRKNKVQINRINVLRHLAENSGDFKSKVQKLIYSTLVSELVKERRWDELMEYLTEMEENKIHFSDVEKIAHQIKVAEDILFTKDLNNFKLIQCIDKLKALSVV